MLNTLIKMVNVLKADATLTAIVPATQMFVGPVDVTEEAQSSLLLPQINLTMIGESSRTVPPVRDTRIQLDIWTRNSQLELETIYERIVTLLNYVIADQGSTHIYWQRLESAVDQYEGDRRVWHRACDFTVWNQ